MSETKEEVTEKKKSAAPVIGGVLLVLAVVVFGGLYASSQNSKAAEAEDKVSDAAQAVTEAAQDVTEAAAEKAEEVIEGAQEAATEAVEAVSSQVEAVAATAQVELDIASLAKPRILGNPDSPLKISEHSSFTCGGCGHFHGDNFKKIKADYIDTGKAHVVFDDFPRNIADLEIGMVARCLPEQSYFNFTQLMFETQSQWATETGYKTYLRQNAILAGLSEEKFDACINSEALKEALAANREAAQAKFNVNATPTLVLNDSTVISGLTPYAELQKAFDAEIAKKAAQ